MSETLTPVFRLEYFITAAANGTPCDLEPIFNEEKYLHAIAGASVDLPMPVGRTQEYLAKLAGMDVEIPDHPIFRTEYYLAHMIDSTVECPAPIFREEMFYYEWASNEYVTISGNPVSFTAKAAPLRQLEVAFSPVQDLHGYDNPWPAGGGKNLFNGEYRQGYYAFADGSFAAVDTWITTKKIPCKASTYYTASADEKLTRYQGMCFWDENEDFIRSYSDATAQNIGFTAQSPANAAFLSFNIAGYPNSNNEIHPADVTHLQIEEGQTATSYAPYSNLCPISGWSSLTVEQRGKNLWNADISSDGQNIDKLTYAGQASGYAVYSFPVPANTQMRVKAITLSSLTSAILIQSTKNGADYGNAVSISQLAWAHERVLTSNSDGVLYLLTNTSPQQTIQAATESEVEIEVGTQEIAAYVPYNPSSRSISISLGQTVYSGYVDVISGVGEVTHGIVTLNGSEAWAGSVNSAYVPKHDMKRLSDYRGEMLCDQAAVGKTSSAFVITERPCVTGYQESASHAGQNWIYYVTKAGTFASLAELKAFLTENPITVVYPLATPIPIQLTPQEVESLAGDNTMFTPCDSLTVEYRSN